MRILATGAWMVAAICVIATTAEAGKIDFEGIASTKGTSNDPNVSTRSVDDGGGIDFTLTRTSPSGTYWLVYDEGFTAVGSSLIDHDSDFLGLQAATKFTLDRDDDADFMLVEVDLGEHNTGQAPATAIKIVGTKTDGTTLTTTLTTNGHTGSEVPDFETFTFGAAWTNLTKVSFETTSNVSWSIDNIRVESAPLPPAALMGLGLLAGIGLFQHRRRRKLRG